MSVALVRDTRYNGHDFTVFWKTAHYLLDGFTLYSVERDGSMVFKYPPWSIVAFLPLTLFPLHPARILWGLLEVISLASILFILLKNRVRTLFVLVTCVAYWGIWVVHALDGQIELPMLCFSLWLGTKINQENGKWRKWKELHFAAIFYVLSTKIFTVFPLLEWWNSFLRPKTLFVILGILMLLSLPALWVLPTHHFRDLLSVWAATAGKEGNLQLGDKIRGWENQGVPALVLRIFEVPSSQTSADIWTSLVIGLGFGYAWHKISRNYRFFLRWVGWLGLTPVVHPLAWIHLFVFTFPLAAVSLEMSWLYFQAERSVWGLCLSVAGILMIGCITEKTVGPMGHQLGLASVKSWGTLCCLSALIISQGKWRLPLLRRCKCWPLLV